MSIHEGSFHGLQSALQRGFAEHPNSPISRAFTRLAANPPSKQPRRRIPDPFLKLESHLKHPLSNEVKARLRFGVALCAILHVSHMVKAHESADEAAESRARSLRAILPTCLTLQLLQRGHPDGVLQYDEYTSSISIDRWLKIHTWNLPISLETLYQHLLITVDRHVTPAFVYQPARELSLGMTQERVAAIACRQAALTTPLWTLWLPYAITCDTLFIVTSLQSDLFQSSKIPELARDMLRLCPVYYIVPSGGRFELLSVEITERGTKARKTSLPEWFKFHRKITAARLAVACCEEVHRVTLLLFMEELLAMYRTSPPNLPVHIYASEYWGDAPNMTPTPFDFVCYPLRDRVCIMTHKYVDSGVFYALAGRTIMRADVMFMRADALEEGKPWLANTHPSWTENKFGHRAPLSIPGSHLTTEQITFTLRQTAFQVRPQYAEGEAATTATTPGTMRSGTFWIATAHGQSFEPTPDTEFTWADTVRLLDSAFQHRASQYSGRNTELVNDSVYYLFDDSTAGADRTTQLETPETRLLQMLATDEINRYGTGVHVSRMHRGTALKASPAAAAANVRRYGPSLPARDIVVQLASGSRQMSSFRSVERTFLETTGTRSWIRDEAPNESVFVVGNDRLWKSVNNWTLLAEEQTYRAFTLPGSLGRVVLIEHISDTRPEQENFEGSPLYTQAVQTARYIMGVREGAQGRPIVRLEGAGVRIDATVPSKRDGRHVSRANANVHKAYEHVLLFMPNTSVEFPNLGMQATCSGDNVLSVMWSNYDLVGVEVGTREEVDHRTAVHAISLGTPALGEMTGVQGRAICFAYGMEDLERKEEKTPVEERGVPRGESTAAAATRPGIARRMMESFKEASSGAFARLKGRFASRQPATVDASMYSTNMTGLV